MKHSEERNWRIAIYVDVIFALISSILSLIGITYVVNTEKIENLGLFTLGLTFWICYLLLSLFLIGFGIYSHYQEKNFDKKKPKYDVKAPIV